MPLVLPFRSSFTFRASVVAACCLGLGGCAHETRTPLRRGEHEVRVNATASGPVKPGTAFVVTPTRREPGAESTLLYAEAARQVKGALMARGLYEAPDPAHAATIVEIEFSMETPKVSRAAPPDAGGGSGQGRNPGAVAIDDPSNIRSAQRGPLAKNLVLTAREARPSGGAIPRTLWSVELSTVDESTDLRKYLPLLAASAISQIGVDSGGPQTVRINESDKSVTLIRQSR